METRGIGGFQEFTNNLISKAGNTPQAEGKELSEAERNMIESKFKPGNSPIDLYGSSGSVRTENPGAKGGNIDFTV